MALASEDGILQVLAEQNPWHALNAVPLSLAKPYVRVLAHCLAPTLISPRVERYQMITGPRRVGKTVTMYQVVRQLLADGISPRRLWWMHLDHPLLMRRSLDEIVKLVLKQSGATKAEPAYIFLDEINYAPDWDLWLKTFYDEQRPLRILATASSTAALRQGRVESGIGRWDEHYLSPCLFPEYLDMRQRKYSGTVSASLADSIESIIAATVAPDWMNRELTRYLLVGGFPELLLRESGGGKPEDFQSGLEDRNRLASDLLDSQRHLRADAVQRALYVDIPQIFGIGEPAKLERLLFTLAGQICGILSPANIARSIGLTPPTVEKYIGYLDRSYLLFLLPNFAPSEEAIQRRGRKLYFVEGAVRNAALQRGMAVLDDPTELGSLRENSAAAHLHALGQQTGVRVYYWRHGKREVDLIYDDAQKPMAFEIGSSPRHDISALRDFQKQFPGFAGRCYLVTPDPVVVAPHREGQGDFTIGRLPLHMFLLATGAQTLAATRMKFGFS